ncbi:hypothetical protein QBC38DRAFT_426038 [Podospora fimiseda]|uniref:Uncharacterized protein n=1 Tax=Podospora fimiseda TaxID=252190 RepID=A0AAN7GU40_9PEZI|nr:hypothetical protein QBC38DRAFT_426038 [Podospora fimiseda]
MAGFRPTPPRFSAAASASKIPMTRAAPGVVVPSLVVAGAIYGVVSYVRSQLRKESDTINRMFAQRDTPEAIESRRRALLVDTEGDPRKSIYNVLNWK